MNLTGIKHLIVGSGFWGATLAERIASDLNEKVVIVERRDHIGGNSYSEIDSETGVEVHRYGSHIFHTKNTKVWDYVNRFSAFNNYQHKVLTTYKNKVYPIPISLATINQFYGLNLKPFEVESFILEERKKSSKKFDIPKNFEEKGISLIGEPLYKAFIEGYTLKQWEKHPSLLPESIINRLPVRSNYNMNYFDDPFQGIPVEGYAGLFTKMLTNEHIEVVTGVDFFDIKHMVPSDCKVYYSGPIDRFFDFKYGALEWRSLRFEKENINQTDYQGTAVMNYADGEIPFTRIHEFKHYHPERDYSFSKTTIFREFSMTWAGGKEPYYPVNTPENQKKLDLYRADSEKLSKYIFGGRLGSYRYWDMEQAISAALEIYESKIKSRRNS